MTVHQVDVVRLRDFWARHGVHRGAYFSQANEWRKDQLLIHGLGIGIEQIYRYLSVPRSFEELEAWILGLNGGAIDRQRLSRLNAALTNAPYDSITTEWLDGIDRAPTVFNDDAMEAWYEQGFIVLHDAIEPEECRAAVDAVYEFIGASPANPSTWHTRQNMQGIMVQIYSIQRWSQSAVHDGFIRHSRSYGRPQISFRPSIDAASTRRRGQNLLLPGLTCIGI